MLVERAICMKMPRHFHEFLQLSLTYTYAINCLRLTAVSFALPFQKQK